MPRKQESITYAEFPRKFLTPRDLSQDIDSEMTYLHNNSCSQASMRVSCPDSLWPLPPRSLMEARFSSCKTLPASSGSRRPAAMACTTRFRLNWTAWRSTSGGRCRSLTPRVRRPRQVRRRCPFVAQMEVAVALAAQRGRMAGDPVFLHVAAMFWPPHDCLRFWFLIRLAWRRLNSS